MVSADDRCRSGLALPAACFAMFVFAEAAGPASVRAGSVAPGSDATGLTR
jgi:hypothetical protein